MSLYTIIGDPHLTHKSLDRGEQLFGLVEELGFSTIWLGDFLDTKEVIRGKCLNALISYLSRSKLHHYVLIGNHDWFNLECKAHALEALKLLANVTVVDEPREFEGGLVLFPYIHDRAKLLEKLAYYSNKNLTLFAHLEVTNFDFGNGHVCTNGIPLSALKGFPAVISGHFHKYQKSGNLIYLGTPFSHSFGEANQTKFIGLFDYQTRELKIADTPFPKHISIEFNCDNLNETLDHWIFDDPSVDNFYRVILTGSQANIDRFPKQRYEKLNVKWIARPTDDSMVNVSIDETASNEVQFSRWATEIRKMDAETLKLGLSILEACK